MGRPLSHADMAILMLICAGEVPRVVGELIDGVTLKRSGWHLSFKACCLGGYSLLVSRLWGAW
jgi:hypothetical protein